MDDGIYAQLVRTLGDEALKRVVDGTAASLQAQPSVLAGEDSGLGTVWLEFAAQIQGDASPDWDDFVLHVKQTIEGQLLGLTEIESQALMLRTPDGRDWLYAAAEERGEAPNDVDALVELAYGKVRARAMDLEDDRLQRFLYPGRDDFNDYVVDDDDETTGQERAAPD